MIPNLNMSNLTLNYHNSGVTTHMTKKSANKKPVVSTQTQAKSEDVYQLHIGRSVPSNDTEVTTTETGRRRTKVQVKKKATVQDLENYARNVTRFTVDQAADTLDVSRRTVHALLANRNRNSNKSNIRPNGENSWRFVAGRTKAVEGAKTNVTTVKTSSTEKTTAPRTATYKFEGINDKQERQLIDIVFQIGLTRASQVIDNVAQTFRVA